MILSVPPSNFVYYFRNKRDSIKEIIKVADTEITYTTYDNHTITKKIAGKTYVNHFLDGRTPEYTLEDGDKVEIFNYHDFDWRNYPLEKNEALLDAVHKKNADKIIEALENGADVNYYDRRGDRALHYANTLEICKILIERGADIEARESCGMTALHLAARDGNVEIGRYLLEQGAKVDAIDMTDKTPLFTALEEGNYDFCKLLLRYGADPNYECKHEELTSLELAELYARGEEYPVDYGEERGMTEEQYAEMAKLMRQNNN